MSEVAVRDYAKTYPRTEVYKPDRSNLPDLVVAHRDTKVNCWFDEDGLSVVNVVWISEPMRVTEEPQRELCDRE